MAGFDTRIAVEERYNNDTQTRIDEINARIDEMHDTLEGCDWCCGGGDEEMDELRAELTQLEAEQRRAWAAQQPPLLSSLDERDAEDTATLQLCETPGINFENVPW